MGRDLGERRVKVTLEVNGVRRDEEVDAWALLVEYLRESLGLTGTKVGCETSVCGACSVLLDGAAVKSCTMLAVQAQGASITTVEGLAATPLFAELAGSMQEEHGVQCGFCTPGLMASLVALLTARPDPGPDDIATALDGNLCRCTGYVGVIRAVERAAALRRGERPPSRAGASLADALVVTEVAAGGVAGADVEVV